jgi:hypothetical protein
MVRIVLSEYWKNVKEKETRENCKCVLLSNSEVYRPSMNICHANRMDTTRIPRSFELNVKKETYEMVGR